MDSIQKIDSNFKSESKIAKEDIVFYDIKNAPFQISGVYYEDGKYRRMPLSEAEKVSSAVKVLSTKTAGGRVRFRTDSPYVAIHALLPTFSRMHHMAFSGSGGFDLYEGVHENSVFLKTFIPPSPMVDCLEGVYEGNTPVLREYTINFPLYSEVSELYVGLSRDAVLEVPTPYRIQKPIVYYGSSVTQGGCASRPGSCYQSILSRKFGADYINLGFSGSAKGEQAIADYIKGLDMSLFVLDYDYNAPTIEHLEQTHERMFLTIRRAHPNLPIIIASQPRYLLSEVHKKRMEIIRRTYEKALERGDRNVYFISGPQLMAIAGNEGTVDNCHPTDLGFFSMACAFENVMREVFSSCDSEILTKEKVK